MPLTTISLDNPEGDGRALLAARKALELLIEAQRSGVLRLVHHVHLRCELTDDGVVEAADQFMAKAPDLIALASLMDHSPGQGQFKNLDLWRGTVAARLGHDPSLISRCAKKRQEASATWFRQRARRLAEIARDRGILVASHDVETADEVRFSAEVGARICEFPMSEAVARAACNAGQLVIVGAPNLVNGGSHMGNISAAELIKAVPDVALTYDYAPGALTEAWILLRSWTGAVAASRATSDQTRRVLLGKDGFSLVPGARADFIQIREIGEFLQVQAVWQLGNRVA
jgi:alpha-D-ribose 1-methylphosphonate 5-triphosphate diphosphatase